MAKKGSNTGQGLPVKSAKPVPVKIVSDVNSIAGPDAKEQKKWRAEDDIRTMQRAEEIRKDKERMKAMKEIAKQQVKDLKKIF